MSSLAWVVSRSGARRVMPGVRLSDLSNTMNLREIEPPALHKLEGYLEAVSEFIRTGELKWYFDVRLFECEETGSDVRLFIGEIYPDAKLEKAEISEAS